MKKIAFLLLIIAIILSGCAKPDNQITQTESDKEVNMETIITTTSYIKISDVTDDMYTQELDITLDVNETAALLSALSSSAKKDSGFSRKLLYCLDFYDKDDRLIEKAIVDLGKTLGFKENGFILREGELDSILAQLEEKYEVSYTLFKRTPGKNFFGTLSLGEYANLYEITENNFIEGLDIDFAGERLSTLSALLDNASIDGELEKVDTKYIIDIYTENGGELYQLRIDDNFNLYTDNGYKINDVEIKSWFNTLQ